MAFKRLAVDGVTPPFLQMVQDGKVAAPYFTVWMTALVVSSPQRYVAASLQ